MLRVYSEHPAGPAGELGTRGAGKGGRDPGRGAGQAEVLGGSTNMHVLVNLESVVSLLH